MFVSNEEIYKAIVDVQNEIAELKLAKRKFKAELLVEELSLSRAAKLIHTKTSVLLEEVKAGKLRAMAHPSGDLSRLRFRVADLLEWQELREVEAVKDVNAPSIDEIFNKAREKALGV